MIYEIIERIIKKIFKIKYKKRFNWKINVILVIFKEKNNDKEKIVYLSLGF